MAMSINTNMGSLRAQQAAANVSNDMQQAMNRLSTGQRINSASDDAAGSAIASRLTSEIRGTNQAIRNALDSQALIDTAEGAQQEIENILQRMRELAVQAANDTNSDGDRANIQLEIDQLATELDRIAVSTTWGGKQLLNGSSGSNPATSFDDATEFKFQIGSSAKASDNILVTMGAVSAQALGVGSGAAGVDVNNVNFESAGGDVPAYMTYADGTLRINGDVKLGDSFSFKLQDVSVTVTVAAADGFEMDAAGTAALIRQDILTKISSTDGAFENVTVVDNGDGSLSFSQASTPSLANPTVATASGTSESITVTGSKITIAGTPGNGSKLKVDVLGTTISATFDTTSSEYETSNLGMAALLADQIQVNGTIGELVNVVDNGDGSISINQSVIPKISELTTTVSPAAVNKMTAGSAAGATETVTVAGAFKEGRVYSMDVLGETIQVTASASDAYSDDKTGIAEQLAVAVTAFGLSGVTATAASGVVSIKMQPVLSDVSISADVTTASDNSIAFTASSGTLTLYGPTAATSASAAWDVGDKINFTLDGTAFEIAVGTDGYDDTNKGVAQQIGDAIKRFDPTYTVTVSTSNTIVVTRAAKDFISNLDVSDPISSLSYADGTFTVDDSVVAGDIYNFSIEGKDFSVTATDTSASSVSALISKAINDAGFDSLVATDNGDGTVSLAGGGVDVTSAANALASIDAIDNAMTLLSAQRSTLGSITNRIDSTVRNMTNVVVNLEGGRGRIVDADFASESSNLAKAQILNQAATAMLAQANASQQTVLSLLQG